MSTDPFILADRARIVQFGWIGSERCLFQSGECCVDSQGVAWAEKRLGPYCFATTWLGPGWVFDPFSQAHWAADYEVRRAAMTAADDARHAQQLADVVGRLKLGRLAERMLWTIHGKVVEQKHRSSSSPTLKSPTGCGVVTAMLGHVTGERASRKFFGA